MRLIFLKEEGEVTNIETTSDIPSGTITQEIPNDSNISIDNVEPSVSKSIDMDIPRRKLPPPDRNNYNYQIVPYYIPVGARSYYRYKDNYLDYDRIIVRDIIDRDFRFKDGSYGILCRYEGVTITAGSKLNNRKNLIKVDIDGEIFTKRIKDSNRARKITERLIDTLYNRGEEDLLILLIKYKFN